MPSTPLEEIDKIPSLSLSDDNLRGCLSSIIQHVRNFWRDWNFIDHYTNHGIEHSLRVIKILGGLLTGYEDLLNENERFILLAAAYLHDIGMQSPKHAGLQVKGGSYTIEDKERVREIHHEVSGKMIRESVSPQSELDLGLRGPRCKIYAEYIARVAEHHRKLPLEELQDTIIGSDVSQNRVRLKLLAALLRLADALDITCERVNMEVLELRDIPLNSKLYWWSHYYVQGISLEGGRITLYFRFPESYKDSDLERALIDRVEVSLLRDFNEVYDILYDYGLKLHPRVSKVKEYMADNEIKPLDEDLVNYIREMIGQEQSSREMGGRTGLQWFVDGVPYTDDEEVRKCLKRVLELVKHERYLDALKEVDMCLALTVPPMERMIFLIYSGNIYYILGLLHEALLRYKEVLEISKREKVRNIYGDAARNAEASALGNIGLIYRDKGDLDKALEYLQEALEIFTEAEPYRVGQTLRNIAVIYFEKGDRGCAECDEEGFVFLTKALLIPSIEELSKSLTLLLLIISDMARKKAWNRMIRIHRALTSVKLVGVLKSLFEAVYEYAMYKEKLEEHHMKRYEELMSELPSQLKSELKRVLEENA